MKLFKNVDLIDLESILKDGLMPLDSVGSNWGNNNRVDNRTDVVYLFKAQNNDVFPQYGVVLLEVDVDAVENEIADNDVNKGKYQEFIVEGTISPSKIKAAYVPAIFKNRISKDIASKVVFVEMLADYWADSGLEKACESVLKRFSETAEIESASDMNFFRGITPKRTMIDLYNVKYLI